MKKYQKRIVEELERFYILKKDFEFNSEIEAYLIPKTKFVDILLSLTRSRALEP